MEFLEHGANVDVIYLDFAKAFDKVDIGIALQKLNSIGISGKMLAFFESFLKARAQFVCVNGCIFMSHPVLSEVPQGSVLGPLVFLIMLRDTDENLLNSLESSFADDTLMLKRIIHMVDISLLQDDLNWVYQWSAKSNSEINDDKFECMRYGTNLDIKEGISYLTPHGTSVENKEGVKDLVLNDCSFQCTSIQWLHQQNLQFRGFFRHFKPGSTCQCGKHSFCPLLNIAQSFGVLQKLAMHSKSKTCDGLSSKKFIAGQVIGNPSFNIIFTLSNDVGSTTK